MYNCFCKHSVNNIHCRIFLILSEIVKSISYFSDFNENKFVSRKGLCTFSDLSRVCFNIQPIENLKGSKVEMCIHFITETLCPSICKIWRLWLSGS